MRLLLCGGGCGEQTVLANQRFGEMIDSTKPLLYIPLAMQKENYPGCLEWIKGELADINISSIEMATTATELAHKNLLDYCAIFIGGGNTYKLLAELKASGSFETIKEYIKNEGVVFGGSAGAIIFGEDIDTCKYADRNDVNLGDTKGFDVLNGISFLCHYTNESEAKTQF